MDKKIVELKLNETQAVVGGRYAVTAMATTVRPLSASLSVSASSFTIKPTATFAAIR